MKTKFAKGMVVLIFGQMKNGQFKNLILPLPFVFLSGETLTSSDVVFLGLTTEDVNPIPLPWTQQICLTFSPHKILNCHPFVIRPGLLVLLLGFKCRKSLLMRNDRWMKRSSLLVGVSHCSVVVFVCLLLFLFVCCCTKPVYYPRERTPTYSFPPSPSCLPDFPFRQSVIILRSSSAGQHSCGFSPD